jgi:hypothetical protein
MTKEQLLNAAIKGIFIHWSESNEINKRFGDVNDIDINKTVTLKEAQDALNVAALEAPENGGYDKFKYDVIFHGGDRVSNMRLDITRNEYSIINQLIEHVQNTY